MVEEQLLSRFPDFSLGILPLLPPSYHSTALEGRSATIKYEDGLGPEEQELANAPEEPE